MIHKIKALHDDGQCLSIRAIGQELGISRNTVRKYLRQDVAAIEAAQLDAGTKASAVEFFCFRVFSLCATKYLSYVLLSTYDVTHEGGPMTESTFTFRVDDSLKTEFSQAAKAKDRTGAQLLRDYMREFVRQQQEVDAHDDWFRREVQRGIDEANAGDVVSAEEVEAEAAAWRAEMQRKLNGSTSGS